MTSLSDGLTTQTDVQDDTQLHFSNLILRLLLALFLLGGGPKKKKLLQDIQKVFHFVAGYPVALLSIYQGPIAGDISPNGNEILIKNYENILQYNVLRGESISYALQHLPTRHRYQKERQGEAIAWDAVGNGFYTLGEGVNQPLWYHTRLTKN